MKDTNQGWGAGSKKNTSFPHRGHRLLGWIVISLAKPQISKRKEKGEGQAERRKEKGDEPDIVC